MNLLPSCLVITSVTAAQPKSGVIEDSASSNEKYDFVAEDRPDGIYYYGAIHRGIPASPDLNHGLSVISSKLMNDESLP